MSRMITSVSIFIFTISACSPGRESGTNDDNIKGIYVREQTVEVRHPESGDLVGVRQIRDSIFVEPVDEGYNVSNKKWQMKDYENDGWVSMQHSDDRPFSAFVATLDQRSNALQSQDGFSITIDPTGQKLLRSGKSPLTYMKARE